MARDMLSDIPVATAGTPMAAEPNLATAALQVAGTGMQAAEQVGRIEAEKEAQQVEREVEAIISGEHSKAEVLSTKRAQRLKSMFDQGKLTEEALMIEMETEMRRVSNMMGGMFGDSISKSFAKELGVDPSGATVKNALDMLGDGPVTPHAALKGKYGQEVANQIWQMHITGTPLGEAEVKVAAINSDALRIRAAEQALKAKNLTRKELEIEVSNIFRSKANLMMNSLNVNSFVNELKNAAANGELVDSKSVIARLETQRASLLNQAQLMSEEWFGFSAPPTLDDEMAQHIDRMFDPLLSMAENLDKVGGTERMIKFMEGQGKLTGWAASSGYYAASVLGQEEMYLANPNIMKAWPEIANLSAAMQESLVGMLTAEATGDPIYKDMLENNAEAARKLQEIKERTGKSAEELYNEGFKPSILSEAVANTRSTEQARLKAFDELASVSPVHVIKLAADSRKLNGLLGNEKVKSTFQDSLGQVIAGFASTSSRAVVRIPESGVQETRRGTRASTRHQSMPLMEALSEGVLEIAEETGTRPGRTGGAYANLVLRPTKATLERLGEDAFDHLEDEYEVAIPQVLHDSAKAVFKNQNNILMKGQEINSVGTLARYVQSSLTQTSPTPPATTQPTTPETAPTGEWNPGEKRSFSWGEAEYIGE